MRPFYRLASLIVLFVLLRDAKCWQKHQKVYEFKTKLQRHLTPSPLFSSSFDVVKNVGRVFYPIGYGADPSGARDSTEAIMNAVADAARTQTGLQLVLGVNDLGGVIVDFQGGNFVISKPIVFPPGSGNLVIQSGTLRASRTFPVDGHLVELQSSNPTTNFDSFLDNKDENNAIRYEDITFRDILFDSSYIGGGLHVVDSARTRITNCFFTHFVTEGILVERGHETFISNTFLGQVPTVGGDRRERDFSGTAIDLASNDNAVTDVVIFSAAVGITLRGQANILTGVHCYNKATGFGGVGILVKSARSRIDSCYMDYNSIGVHDPSQVHISNGFFLGGGNVVLKSISGRISGLNVVNNMFSGGGDKGIVELDGEFSSVDQVVIDGNDVDGGMSLKSTIGKMRVSGNGTRWTGNFSGVFVFPNRISHVQYSVYNTRGTLEALSGHAVTNVSGNVVVVESDKQMNAIVWFVVYQ